MEWIEKLNQAVRYMEEHITEEISYEQLGRVAGCSACHFQRMFTYMASMPLSEYIRRRRMSLAAVDLQDKDAKVLDIALKYGYSSPTAFNRAFQSVHGIAPAEAKKPGRAVKSFPPISFELTVKGREEMEYRLEQKEAFRIIGVSKPLYQSIEKNFEVVPGMWQEAVMNGTLQKLAGMMDAEPKAILGISVCDDEDQWSYYIAAASTMQDEAFEEYVIPASAWAVFPGSGTNQSVQELERRIVMEWLPDSGYEYANAPDIEVYLNPDPANAQYEIWLPVVKKQK